jgi:hypothetical protein
MIILGLILLLLGFLLGIGLLYTLGAILLVVGVVLMLLGQTGPGLGWRRPTTR